MSRYTKNRGGILSGYGVIGGDDKCGIYIILELLKEFQFNFVFSVQEEIGGNGIKDFIAKADFSNIIYSLVLDRRGSGDILCSHNNYGTKDFEKVLEEIGKAWGYKSAIGTFSDANFIKEKISCANLSVGYYLPHSKSEFVNISHLNNALGYIRSIIKNITTKFEPVEKISYAKIWENPEWDYSQYFSGNPVKTCDLCYKKAKTKNVKILKKELCETCIKDLSNELLEIEWNEENQQDLQSMDSMEIQSIEAPVMSEEEKELRKEMDEDEAHYTKIMEELIKEDKCLVS